MMLMMRRAGFVCAAAAVAAAVRCSALTFVGMTHDWDNSTLQQIVHVDSAEQRAGAPPLIHVDFPLFGNDFDSLDASIRAPWEYVVLLDLGGGYGLQVRGNEHDPRPSLSRARTSPHEAPRCAQVLNVAGRNGSLPVPLGANVEDIHCTATAGYATDIDKTSIVRVDTATGIATQVCGSAACALLSIRPRVPCCVIC